MSILLFDTLVFLSGFWLGWWVASPSTGEDDDSI